MRSVLGLLFVFTVLFLVQCGGPTLVQFKVDVGGEGVDESLTESPFEGRFVGDGFEWGEFIHYPYQTTEVTSFPIPIYLAYFSEDQEEIVAEGVAIANEAVGYDVFEIVDTWSSDTRVIYKVNEIDFDVDEEISGVEDFGTVIGYTYTRNVYINGLYDAGRVVTDWAIEIRFDHVNELVVAHELGHAMGIQEHALIDYENDTITDLEPYSLMDASMNVNPTFDDYEYMMEEQGEILMEYLENY